jgi:hypothetical protein
MRGHVLLATAVGRCHTRREGEEKGQSINGLSSFVKQQKGPAVAGRWQPAVRRTPLQLKQSALQCAQHTATHRLPSLRPG